VQDSSILELVKKTATRVGACDPQWLKKGNIPEFKARELPSLATGKGPELLLLHGLLGALSNWDAAEPLFAKFAKPIALEFPILTGHHSEVKIKALAAYTEFFIRQREIGPVTLCGNSLGGHVAMRLYFACPELVDCMILTGTSGLYEHTVDTLPVRPDRKFIRENMSRVFFDNSFVTDSAIEQMYQILTNRGNMFNLIHAARSAKKDNLKDLLKQIKVPVLLIWGKNDAVTTMDVCETFHREIPNSECVVFDNCGHAPMIEHPQRFAEEVEKFMRKHSRFYRSPL